MLLLALLCNTLWDNNRMGNVKQGVDPNNTQPGGLAQGAGLAAPNAPTAVTQQPENEAPTALNMPKPAVRKPLPARYAKPALLAPRMGSSLPPQAGGTGGPIINPPQRVVPQGAPQPGAPAPQPAPMPPPPPAAPTAAPTTQPAPMAAPAPAQGGDLQQENTNLRQLLQQLFAARKQKGTPTE
jgi:hypothetical protein